MKLVNITTAQLEYLVAAVEQPTWAQAASANGVTPSALSQGLAELERRLGVRLFDKQGRRRVPTAEAHRVVVHATRVLAEVRELSRWADEARGGTSGQLSIGMIDTAAIHHFGDTLVAFRKSHPGLGVRLHVAPSRDLQDQLRAGELDAIVCVDPQDDGTLVLTPLVTEPLYVYAPPGTTVGPPSTWGPWVSFPPASRTRALIAQRLRGRGAPFEVVAESSQPAVLKEMVQLGMGWTVLAAVDAEQAPHTLRRAATEPVAERVLTLARRADREPNPALSRLLASLNSPGTVLSGAGRAKPRRSP